MGVYLGDKPIGLLTAQTAVNMGECVTDGEYDEKTNKVATQQTVRNAVEAAEISLDGKVVAAKTEAATALSTHNASQESHNDLRIALQALSDKLTAFLDSDEVSLDQLSELITAIKENQDYIGQKVNVTDIVNGLTTNVADKPLSAAQGVALKALIDNIPALLGLSSGAVGNPATPIYWDGTKFTAGQPTGTEKIGWAMWKEIADGIAAVYDGSLTEDENRANAAAKAAEYGVKIGDEVNVELTTGETFTFQIWGFNHDALADGSGGRAGITFGMKDLISETAAFDTIASSSTSTNRTYLDSATRVKISEYLAYFSEIADFLPVKDVIKYSPWAWKKSNLATAEEGAADSADRFFLFSSEELNVEGESAYAYWKGKLASSRVKYLSDGKGAMCAYWLRDTESTWQSSSSWAHTAARMSTDGGVGYVSVTSTLGICFGFCI